MNAPQCEANFIDIRLNNAATANGVSYEKQTKLLSSQASREG